jgi:hypothetical protein
MNKEFAPYEPSLALKELGFDEPCFAWYDGRYPSSINQDYCKNSEEWLNMIHCATPTFSQAFRWFRKKQEIEGFVHKSIEGNYYFVIKRIGNNESNMYEFTKTSPKTFDTYEEAELECLKKLIEIVKQK